MKIVIYGLNFIPEPVGIGKYSGELSCWLSEQGHQVRVITSVPYFPSWRIFASFRNRYTTSYHDRVSVQRCPLWVPLHPTGFTRLVHLLSFALSSFCPLLSQMFWRPDVVITVAPAFFCAPGALLLGRLCDSRTTTWLHVQDFELDAAFELGLLKGKVVRHFAQFWERRIFRGFSCVSSISATMVTRLGSKGVLPSRRFLLPNWVDLNVIRPQSQLNRIHNPYRRELCVTPDQIVLMYSGSMNKKQGLDLLVQVIHELSDLPNVVWILAGEGPTKAQLLHDTQGLTQVHHLPLQPTERLNDWLNFADIHLLPQKGAAADLVLPSKLLGILASGKPLVATSPPGSELSIIASECGFCVLPNDIHAFSKSLRCLISDHHLRNTLGRRARQYAEHNFGKDHVLSKFQKQLMEVHSTP